MLIKINSNVDANMHTLIMDSNIEFYVHTNILKKILKLSYEFINMVNGHKDIQVFIQFWSGGYDLFITHSHGHDPPRPYTPQSMLLGG